MSAMSQDLSDSHESEEARADPRGTQTDVLHMLSHVHTEIWWCGGVRRDLLVWWDDCQFDESVVNNDEGHHQFL